MPLVTFQMPRETVNSKAIAAAEDPEIPVVTIILLSGQHPLGHLIILREPLVIVIEM